MSKICRKCKTGTMIEKETTQDLTVKGVSLHVAGLRHFECDVCAAQVETAVQFDYNAELIQAACDKPDQKLNDEPCYDNHGSLCQEIHCDS